MPVVYSIRPAKIEDGQQVLRIINILNIDDYGEPLYHPWILPILRSQAGMDTVQEYPIFSKTSA